ncbi:MAG TPA: hypothetical protein G4O04_09890 [Anaerolineae bacterium]|nr:hypothetical protein [Anaerolineae bacterium]HID85502.1 hypothetical protein [Anaerolineales bacterium]HIQ09664.1 hypothetical protein [Anaerolineaceae bacterium]
MSPAKDVFEICTFQDLVSALRVRPEWREELRPPILTDELMDLPRKFDAFVQGEFRPLQRDVTTLKQDVKTLKQDVETLKQDVEVLRRGMWRFSNRMSGF